MMMENDVFIADGAKVLGDVKLGEDCSVWFNAVVRGDRGSIQIGDETNIQDNCVLHSSWGKTLTIGKRVSVGHGAIIHGCNIGDDCLVGIGAIILNEVEIGEFSLVGAGAVVTPGTKIPAGSMVLGIPAKVVREVTQEEKDMIVENAEIYVKLAKEYIQGTRD